MRYRILTALAVLVVLTLSVFCYLFPIYPALICPGCFGFEKVSDNFYIQTGVSRQKRKEIVENYDIAQIRVSAVLGPIQSKPIIFACNDELKFRSLGGGKERWQVLAQTAINFSPRSLNVSAMGHSLSHLELKLKVGGSRASSAIPAWFDEGLAVLVSKDARYTGEPKDGEMTELNVQALKSRIQWQNAIAEGKKVYAPSYRVVKNWFDKAGQAGVNELIERVKKGEPFARIYTELGDRP
ncbi:MAG: hypothetical protein ACRBBN_03875 [Methyloligellaceae bacterium]